MNKTIIFSAPSGSGKTTIVKHLLSVDKHLAFSISACTRKKRANEMNGKDYFFISVDEFKKKISENAFLEYEEVYEGNFYGTLKSEIEKIWNEKKIVIFDVDVEGGLKLKKIFGENALAVFVKPPSVEELTSRLRQRSTESDDVMKKRLEKAKLELSFEKEFDFVLLNNNLDETFYNAQKLVNEFLTK